MLNMKKVLSVKKSEVLASKIIEHLCAKYDCQWWYAFEDMGGYDMMVRLGVHPDVIHEYCMDM